MLVAWRGGTGPALFATALAILAFDYFFLLPARSFAFRFEEVPRIALFAIAALFRRRAERGAAAGNDRAPAGA